MRDSGPAGTSRPVVSGAEENGLTEAEWAAWEGLRREFEMQDRPTALALLDAFETAVNRSCSCASTVETRTIERDTYRHAAKFHAARAAELREALEQADGMIDLMSGYLDDLLDRARSTVERPEYQSPGAFAMYAKQRLEELVARAAARAASAASPPGGQE